MTKKQNITAIIYDKRGRVLSIGKNSYVKTHPRMAEIGRSVGLHHKKFIHAELDSILKCRDLSKAHRIFVSRFTKDGEPALAKPCPICERAIMLAGIEIVEHT
jgi:deoxycytidylate deaminase